MIDRPDESSHPGVGDADLSMEDEAFLDDVFDLATSKLLNGEPADPTELASERPHLQQRVAHIIQLASEVAGVGPVAISHAIPGYEIVRELGRGGMGSVFLAQQLALAGRLVALKVMPHGAALSNQARARFRSEVEALARIRHANVIDIYDVVDIEATPAYAMEWVDGRSLLELIDYWVAMQRPAGSDAFAMCLGGDLGDRPAAKLVAQWGKEVADALVAAHREGLLHRDVKPANIMVRRDGTALLTDFGLVRDEASGLATRSGAFLGTPAYAAPEQLRGTAVDARSDVYGLGATLYHALTGIVPFGHLPPAKVLHAVEVGALRPLRATGVAIEADLQTIVETAMDVDPARRYLDARALSDDLDRYLQGRPIAACPASTWSRIRKFSRRNRSSLRGALLGSLVAVALAIGLAVYWIGQARIPAQFAEFVRSAHLAMLDPSLDERMAVMLHDAVAGPGLQTKGDRDSWSGTKVSAALLAFDQALSLRKDDSVRLERETLVLAQSLSSSAALPDGLVSVAPQTFTFAHRWQQLGQLPDTAVSFDQMTRSDRRCLGLLALLRGADSLCVAAWRGLDLADKPDPLVDAAIGQLYRQRGQPQLAWPRLERALEHFHEAQFLTVAIAEVALECGDPDYALRMLDGVDERSDVPYDAETRVRADALFALGRTAEARPLYLAHAAAGNVPPSSHESLAAFFESDGDYERAFHHRWRVQLRWPQRTGVRPSLAALLATWWAALSVEQRHKLLEHSVAVPGTFLDAWLLVREELSVAAHGELAALTNRFLPGTYSLLHLRAWPEDRARRYLRDAFAGVAPSEPLPSGPLPDEPKIVPLPHDMVSATELLSQGFDGQPANGACQGAAVDQIGRVVVFSSDASNLVVADSNASRDVFLRNRARNVVNLVSVAADGGAADGASELPAVSANGDWVAFYSSASNLVAEDVNGHIDCFVTDLRSMVTICVSVGEQGLPAGIHVRPIHPPCISQHGERILYAQQAPAGGAVLRLVQRESLEVIWTSPLPDARWLRNACYLNLAATTVFATTTDARILEHDANLWMSDAFAFDVGGGEIKMRSEVGGRAADCECRLAGIVDPRWSLLWTMASNLVTAPAPGQWQLLLHDRQRDSCTRIGDGLPQGLAVREGAATTGERTVFRVGGTNVVDAEQVWLREGSKLYRLCGGEGARSNGGRTQGLAISGDGQLVVVETATSEILAGVESSDALPRQIVGLRLRR